MHTSPAYISLRLHLVTCCKTFQLFLCSASPRKAMKLLLVVASLLVAHAAAHVCLLFPHQRGSMQELNAMG